MGDQVPEFVIKIRDAVLARYPPKHMLYASSVTALITTPVRYLQDSRYDLGIQIGNSKKFSTSLTSWTLHEGFSPILIPRAILASLLGTSPAPYRPSDLSESSWNKYRCGASFDSVRFLETWETHFPSRETCLRWIQWGRCLIKNEPWEDDDSDPAELSLDFSQSSFQMKKDAIKNQLSTIHVE